jgi:hypothetical protein
MEIQQAAGYEIFKILFKLHVHEGAADVNLNFFIFSFLLILL